MVVAVLAAALAIVITVLVLRGGRSEGSADAAVAVTHDASVEDRLDEGLKKLKQLDKLKDLGKLKQGLEAMRDDLQGMRPEVGDDEMGRLELTADAEATIYEGDTALGTTPLDLELPAGKHELRAVYKNGREQTSTIEIRARKTTHEKLATW